MRRRFVTLDVFTSRPFARNPLAVVLDAKGLDEAVMQAIAREFNLAETVFVLPAEKASHRALLRISPPSPSFPLPVIRQSGRRSCSTGSTAVPTAKACWRRVSARQLCDRSHRC